MFDLDPNRWKADILRFFQQIYPPAPHWKFPLYPFQFEFTCAAVELIADCRSGRCPPRTMAVQIARQGGKSSGAGRLDAYLLTRYNQKGGEIVKTAPTRQPQLETCHKYIEAALGSINAYINRGKGPKAKPVFTTHGGWNFNVGKAWLRLVSGDPDANNHGHTASICLEVDEAQHFNAEVYRESFRPMLATTSAATILYGSQSKADCFLNQEVERLLVLEKEIGRRLVFRYPWEVVAAYNPRYLEHVLSERAELGESHPIFQSQYCLKPVDALGKLFTPEDLLRLTHETDSSGALVGTPPARFQYPRMRGPEVGAHYVAGVDLCGVGEQNPEDLLAPNANPKRDSTVVTVAKLMWRDRPGDTPLPVLQVVDHLYLPGAKAEAVVDDLYRYLFERWRVLQVCVDAHGVGDAVANTLEARRPSQVIALRSKSSEVGYRLQGAVGTGRVKVYTPDADDKTGRAMFNEFLFQMRHIERTIVGQGRMRWVAPTQRGPNGRIIHDDFPKSLGYCVWAASERHLYTRITKQPEIQPVYQFGKGLAA